MDKPSILVLGGTGSLGKTLVGQLVEKNKVYVFSRDEAKHVIIKGMYPEVNSIMGDIRDRDSVFSAILRSKPDIIINAAALKNVPEVEESPMEGIKTSIIGTENLINAAKVYQLSSNKPMKLLTISTDKATKPSTSYGMAKALQERLHTRLNSEGIICNAVRYGNVLESRGSLIPLLKQRLPAGDPVFITHPEMTRFFLTLKSSVDLIHRALADEEGGKIFIPIIRSAKIVDVVDVFREHYGVSKDQVKPSRIRPGEKIDEMLICREELQRTQLDGDVYVIHDVLSDKVFNDITEEYHSGTASALLSREELISFLKENGVFDS